jgi:hypothetical protein
MRTFDGCIQPGRYGSVPLDKLASTGYSIYTRKGQHLQEKRYQQEQRRSQSLWTFARPKQ